jgi:molecular chaperone DnaK (HSP70)
VKYIGIDLGTTNCALAYTGADAESPVTLLDIPQVVAPGQVFAEDLLESCVYLAAPGEFEGAGLDLPWAQARDYVVGAFAHRRGAETTGRLVTSPKSWLSCTGANRTDAILPSNATEGGRRISPVEASRLFLEHLRESWNHAHPEETFEQRPVVLTVPASFDAVARDLTQKAAEQAGYKNLVLLEEPQAALYAWIERHPDWRERVSPGDLILVVDVGGGTTDFSLIAVVDHVGSLALERVAVGDHLLLGGDNMDLALAHSVAASLNRKLDAFQLQALWQQCRSAKERLFSDEGKEEETVSILGRGSGLIGGTIKGTLTHGAVEQLLVEGFFPGTSFDESPARRRSAGLVELGLPYEPDAAITRHLAKFLRKAGAPPTHVLFNGGVFRAPRLRERLLETLNSWLAKPVESLVGEDLMHAVARGAAYYARSREGRGIRIRGGVPRTYYIGVEAAMPAVPGLAAPLKAITVVPFGLEEGTSVSIPAGPFGLFVGEPADFRFFASADRKEDAPGAVLDEIPEELEELAPIEVTLPADDSNAGQVVHVTLDAHVTETGTLELWCVARDGRRWKVCFNVRHTPS